MFFFIIIYYFIIARKDFYNLIFSIYNIKTIMSYSINHVILC